MASIKMSLLGNLTEAELKGKKVLLRADLNDVPFDDDQNITDDTLIRASVVPAIKFLTEEGAKVILASHLGRQKGVTPKHSLKPLVPRLSELLEADVAMANECIGEETQRLAASLPDGGVMFLEFDEEEEKKDPKFAKKLASLADISANVPSAHTSLLKSDEALPDILGSGSQKKYILGSDILDKIRAVPVGLQAERPRSHVGPPNDTSGGGSVVARERAMDLLPIGLPTRVKRTVQEGAGILDWDDGRGADAEIGDWSRTHM